MGCCRRGGSVLPSDARRYPDIALKVGGPGDGNNARGRGGRGGRGGHRLHSGPERLACRRVGNGGHRQLAATTQRGSWSGVQAGRNRKARQGGHGRASGSLQSIVFEGHRSLLTIDFHPHRAGGDVDSVGKHFDGSLSLSLWDAEILRGGLAGHLIHEHRARRLEQGGEAAELPVGGLGGLGSRRRRSRRRRGWFEAEGIALEDDLIITHSAHRFPAHARGVRKANQPHHPEAPRERLPHVFETHHHCLNTGQPTRLRARWQQVRCAVRSSSGLGISRLRGGPPSLACRHAEEHLDHTFYPLCAAHCGRPRMVSVEARQRTRRRAGRPGSKPEGRRANRRPGARPQGGRGDPQGQRERVEGAARRGGKGARNGQ